MFYHTFVSRIFLLLWKLDNVYDFLYEEYDITRYYIWGFYYRAIRFVLELHSYGVMQLNNWNNTIEIIWRKINTLCSLWNVTRNHPSIVRIRCPVNWTQKCNHSWMHHLSNCDILNIFLTSTFVANSFHYLWISLFSWCKYSTHTSNDNR